jgi:hypothetical protein
VEDSSEENHALALHTKMGGRFKINFRQTFECENPPFNPSHQRRDASDVTSIDTLQEIVQPRRREDNMLLLLTLIQIYLK